MGSSPSVEKVVDKSLEAQQSLQRLRDKLTADSDTNKAEFYAEIKVHNQSAGITDEKEVSFQENLKTEYSSEFDLSLIAAAVSDSLKTLSSSLGADSLIKTPTSSVAIDSLITVVGSVMALAKSNSTSSSTKTFSTNRISPGLYVFLSAISLTVKDEATFGVEAITTTAVYCRVMTSIQNLESIGAFNAAVIAAQEMANAATKDLESLNKLKTIQAALTDKLANDVLTVEQYMAADAKMEEAVNQVRARLSAYLIPPVPPAADDPTNTATTNAIGPHGHSTKSDNCLIVERSVARLAKKGPQVEAALALARARLAENYF